MSASDKLITDLRDPYFRGPMQHLRGWSDLDKLHDAAIAEIQRLRAAFRVTMLRHVAGVTHAEIDRILDGDPTNG